MPDWQALLGDLTAVQVIAWIVAAVLLIGVVIKLWPFIRNSVAIVDALVKLPQMDARMAGLETKVNGIYHELHPNGGTSMNDGLRRVEANTQRLELGVRGLYDKVAELSDTDAELRAADAQLRADLDSTMNPFEEHTVTRRALRAARERRTMTEQDIPD